VVIASPCTVPWESMRGDEGKRFCSQCRLHVYDVSRLPRAEAEPLVRRPEGACLRLYRRPDGTVLTQDCGPLRASGSRRRGALRAALASVLALVGLGGCRTVTPQPTMGVVLPPPEAQPPPPEPTPPPPKDAR